MILASCDEKENNVVPSVEKFPVGNVTWSSEVSAQDKEVISELINDMVCVEATDFFMGAQGRNNERPNYATGYTAGKDTIFDSSIADLQTLSTKRTIAARFLIASSITAQGWQSVL